MDSLAMIILGIVFVLGIGGFSILAFLLLLLDNNGKDQQFNNEMKVLPGDNDFSQRESDLSDHSKIA